MFWRSKSPSDNPALLRGDAAFLTGLHAAQVDEALPRSAWALYLITAAVVSAIAWASLTHVEEITRCDARIIPDGREQSIASLEGGILRELLVREGQQVAVGQDLALLDPTRVEAQQNESQAKRLAMKASVARLAAEANGTPLKFPPDVAEATSIVDSETSAYKARRRLLEEAVSSTSRSIALLQRELGMSQAMAAKGLMSDVEVMRLSRQVNELQEQRNERQNRFRQEASSELVRIQSELAQLDEQLVVREDVLRRTVIKSPVAGLVKNIRVSTTGGVVASGAPIMEIVPLGPRVMIEARIKPSDIGFVQIGQHAEIKLAGYDYNVYGGLKGKIQYISPDALRDAERPGADTSYYRAIVPADISTLRNKGKELPVIPGMTGTLEVKTGERTVLSFLLRPMMKSQEALRER
nr:HlyD family type I secretion periplasmic adaptor subunit [uncultured Roseateles sp.]